MARPKVTNHHKPEGVPDGAIPVHRSIPGDHADRPVEWLLDRMREIGWKATAIGARVNGDQVSVWAVPPSKQLAS